jgi:hypothetical protein
MACFGQQFIDDTDPQIKWSWTGPGKINYDTTFIMLIV